MEDWSGFGENVRFIDQSVNGVVLPNIGNTSDYDGIKNDDEETLNENINNNINSDEELDDDEFFENMTDRMSKVKIYIGNSQDNNLYTFAMNYPAKSLSLYPSLKPSPDLVKDLYHHRITPSGFVQSYVDELLHPDDSKYEAFKRDFSRFVSDAEKAMVESGGKGMVLTDSTDVGNNNISVVGAFADFLNNVVPSANKVIYLPVNTKLVRAYKAEHPEEFAAKKSYGFGNGGSSHGRSHVFKGSGGINSGDSTKHEQIVSQYGNADSSVKYNNKEIDEASIPEVI